MCRTAPAWRLRSRGASTREVYPRPVDSTAAVSPVAHGLLVGTGVVWVGLELRQGIKRRPEGVKANWTSEVVFRLVVVAGILVGTALSRAEPAAVIPSAVGAWIGLGVLWCGIALRLWSVRTLGRYFTSIVQTSSDQPVITDGPYRVIRHPSYTGLLLAITGVGLVIGNWWSLISLTVVMAAGLVFRIRVEERALLRDLGDEYRDYAATHKRLIPFIW
jgi:protein-S-isoprenylcysteine O-methyltransferase Ste14